ncbi:hypothetical protein FYK55_07085 [Roseiconus nitratireducens]|uniref:Uncharacterized protein n=1 Tax=Roseiconus nitratireducens TaxID=2605748 RepID=A0A5M6DD15_9BACT|nr:hypothetical protein [Roseiconus nitratireducens]KAA5545408.1 hypothetical protein FYK55_07085 [Roseiconus nitratireducens]
MTTTEKSIEQLAAEYRAAVARAEAAEAELEKLPGLQAEIEKTSDQWHEVTARLEERLGELNAERDRIRRDADQASQTEKQLRYALPMPPDVEAQIAEASSAINGLRAEIKTSHGAHQTQRRAFRLLEEEIGREDRRPRPDDQKTLAEAYATLHESSERLERLKAELQKQEELIETLRNENAKHFLDFKDEE